MRESRTYGSVRGALSDGRPYRDRHSPNAQQRRPTTVLSDFGALRQFERDLLRERTRAGLTAAARVRKGGRSGLSTPKS